MKKDTTKKNNRKKNITGPCSKSATSAEVREGRMSFGRPRQRWDRATSPATGRSILVFCLVSFSFYIKRKYNGIVRYLQCIDGFKASVCYFFVSLNFLVNFVLHVFFRKLPNVRFSTIFESFASHLLMRFSSVYENLLVPALGPSEIPVNICP